jgi:hypothetical protein
MQKLAKVMYKLFKGRRDTWGARQNQQYFRVTGKEITIENYEQHLLGATIGLYPLLKTGASCFFATLDIDSDNLTLVKRVSEMIPKPNYIERSRSGHYHIWMFFKEPVAVNSLLAACRIALSVLKRECNDHCNLYPLRAKGVGLLIALPFQHGFVEKELTVFIEAEATYDAQREFLKQLKYTAPPGSFLDDKQLKALWNSQGKKTGDKSGSGYDFTFCVELFKFGFSTEVVKKTLARRPGVHDITPEYLEQTVNAAKASLEKVSAAQITTATKVAEWSTIDEIDRETFLERLNKHLVIGKEQLRQFDIFFATIVANVKTKGRPVWLLFVGPPGCGKTLPMMAVQYAPIVYMTSAFRPTALISGFGMKGGEDQSLIPKLDKKILMVKDMSSLLSQHKEVVAEVLGTLRDAYDGACSRSFGTGVERAYTSRFGFIGATTPDIDAHWALNVRLGERFLRFRCRATPEQIYAKIDQTLDGLITETEVDLQIENACMSFLKYLITETEDTEQSNGFQLSHAKTIGRLAQLGAILRTVVTRSPYGKEVLVIPEWEEATRYAKQLAKMALGLAYVRGKVTNDNEETEDLKILIRDAMDARVERICRTVYITSGMDASEIASRVCLPVWTVRSILDDLAIARIVYSQRTEFRLKWFFVPWLSGQVKEFGLWNQEPVNYNKEIGDESSSSLG